MKTVVVRCFKCGEKGHKCRECPLWEKKAKRVACSDGRKAHQEERRLRRVEEKVVCPSKEKVQQE